MRDFLPQHEPPSHVWDAIEAKLPLIALPQHEPTDEIWNKIEAGLEPRIKQKQPIFLKILRGSKLRIAVAATGAILIAAIIGFFIQTNTFKNDVIITQEVIDNRLILPEKGEEKLDVKVIEELCKAANPKCESPVFLGLKKELDDLNVAKKTLQNAIGNYNSDADLIVQLTAIENQESEIVRKMIETM